MKGEFSVMLTDLTFVQDMELHQPRKELDICKIVFFLHFRTSYKCTLLVRIFTISVLEELSV